MEEAGWVVKDGVMTGANGKPFTFEILERNGSAEIKAIDQHLCRSLGTAWGFRNRHLYRQRAIQGTHDRLTILT